MQLILASGSPRRRELLKREGVKFFVEPSRFEEKAEGLSDKETVLTFARGKAREVFSRFPDCAVIGADTVVSLNGAVIGKPYTAERAEEMLRLLSGKTHKVFTGVCLVTEREEFSGLCETDVTFRDLSDELIRTYVEKMRPLDKAGAYGIQDGYPLVESIEGSYTNVVGFPMELVKEYLRKANLC